MDKNILRLKAFPGSLTSQSPETDPAKDPGWDLVRFALNLKYEDLPVEIMDYAKKLILDSLGIMVGGSSADTIPELYKLVRNWGGKEESTILVYGGKVPAPHAAFMMGPMIRSLDMGDVHPMAGHLSEHTIPTLLAALGLKGPIRGQDFISSFVAGVEAGARSGDATFAHASGFINPTDSDLWSLRPPDGPALGASLGVSKMLGLEETKAYTALSIQRWIVGGHTAGILGTLMMRYQHAFMCQSAVNSVLLSQIGVTSPADIYSGSTGYLAAVYPWKNDITLLTKDLGHRWSFATTSLKPYAGCFHNQGPVTAMNELREKYAITPQNIISINVTLPAEGYYEVASPKYCWNPQTMPQAQFSLPYTLATMAVYGKLFVDDFTPEALSRKDVREMMTRIKALKDEKLPVFAGIVKVKLKDGSEYTEQALTPKGNPLTSPLSWEEVIQKFRSCIALSVKPIPNKNITKVIKLVHNLEQCEDVNEIVNLLTP